MQVTVVYSSKYGSTKRYAEELHRRHPGALLELKDFRPKSLRGDVVVFFAPIYAFGLLNLSTLERDISRMQGKKVAIFCVGASNYNKKEFRRLYRQHFDGPLKDVPAFYGRGAWQRDKMTRMDKILLRLNYQTIKNKHKDKLQPWEEEFLTIYGKNWDWVDFSYLDALEEWLKARDPFDD